MALDPFTKTIFVESSWSRDTTPPRVFKLGKVTLRGLKVEITEASERAGAITFACTVAERSTGAPIDLRFQTYTREDFAELTAREQADLVTRALSAFLQHEIMELVTDANGEPFVDPHRGERP